jgi:hypothetical protein
MGGRLWALRRSELVDIQVACNSNWIEVRGSMNEERASLTAEGAAVMGALHQTLDAEPKILDDPIRPTAGRYTERGLQVARRLLNANSLICRRKGLF